MSAKTIGCVAILLAAGLAFGQGGGGTAKATKKSALEVALEDALKGNPDLRVAAAKAAEADAELSRARAQVVQKVVAAYQSIEKAKAGMAASEAALSRARRLYATKAGGSEADVQVAEANLVVSKANLVAVQADMDYLTGRTKPVEELAGRIDRRLLEGDWERAGYIRYRQALGSGLSKGPAADRLRKALEKKSSFKFSDTSAADALEMIRKQAGDVHIQASTKGHAGWSEKLTATLTDTSLAATLQLLEDTIGQRVVVREYGLLIAPADRLPPGAVPLAEFLKSKPEEKPNKAGPAPKQ